MGKREKSSCRLGSSQQFLELSWVEPGASWAELSLIWIKNASSRVEPDLDRAESSQKNMYLTFKTCFFIQLCKKKSFNIRPWSSMPIITFFSWLRAGGYFFLADSWRIFLNNSYRIFSCQIILAQSDSSSWKVKFELS